MKIDFMKLHGGVLTPYTDLDSEKMLRFKTGEVYPGELKTCRNPDFHRKVMGFFRFCFKFWCNKNNYLTAQADYDFFRGELTKIAGYYDEYYDLQGQVTLKAKSLSYGNMEQPEFEECYKAIIQAALDTIFQGCDESMYDQLISFF